VMQVLHEAPREWRSHSPVDAEASRPAEIEFQQSMVRLRKLISDWHERNEADKKALIAQAQQLATTDDTARAVDGAKRLQVQWKETGPVSRDRARALWDEFRGLCDLVFEHRAEAQALHAAELQAAKARAIALREKAERDLRDADAAESNLLEAGRRIRAYQTAVLRDVAAAEREALKNAAEEFIAGVRRWPGGGLQALQLALSQADSASGPDEEAREQALRVLCIRCEILSSTPTPAEDQELRREHQLRLLVATMGQASRPDDQDWDALFAEWIGIGALPPGRHDVFERRFIRCLANRTSKDSRRTR
jgi:exonuclease SbcC